MQFNSLCDLNGDVFAHDLLSALGELRLQSLDDRYQRKRSFDSEA